jgi:oxygen-independent coproporphyrinogen-3 oxidase
MSLYQLTIEPGTRYFDIHAQGKLHVPGEDLAADLYDLTQELTEAAGLPAYEVSNHVKPGHECQHNLLYWRYGEYVGVGPGAHGRLHIGRDVIATACERHPETWREMVAEKGHGLVSEETISPAQQAHEYLLMGLRISEGIDRQRHEALACKPMPAATLARLEELGLVVVRPNRLRATPRGRLVLNALIAELAD